MASMVTVSAVSFLQDVQTIAARTDRTHRNFPVAQKKLPFSMILNYHDNNLLASIVNILYSIELYTDTFKVIHDYPALWFLWRYSMKNKEMANLNAILAAGMALIFIGFIFLLFVAGSVPEITAMILPGVLFLAGFVNIYIFLAYKKSSFRLFLALTLTLYGIFSALISYSVIKVPLNQVWPVFMLIASVTLFIAGRFSGKRFAVSYDFPAMMLFVLGIIFLLFSMGIIKKSFNEIAFIILPLFLIVAGIFLVILFMQRKYILEMLPEDLSRELDDDSEIEESE